MPTVNLNQLEAFLETTSVSKTHYQNKGFEADLKGTLNPTHLLDRLFWQENVWPDFPDFVALYYEENHLELEARFSADIERLGNDFYKHLAARLYRTQFGFYTEYHAVILADKVFSAAGYVVERSTAMDAKGVDFTVLGFSLPCHIHIFVDSPRAWGYRDFKRLNKASNSVSGCHVNFPYQVASGCIHSLRMLKNGFGVYQRSYVEHLRDVLASGRAYNEQEPRVDCSRGLLFNSSEKAGR